MELPEIDSETIDRVLEMAWEDRTTLSDRVTIWSIRAASHRVNAARNEGFEFSDVAQARHGARY